MAFRTIVALGLLVTLAAAPVPAQAPRVAIGLCAPLGDLDAVKAAGFDYAEVPTTEVTALTDAAFEEVVARAKQIALPVPAANLFLPAALKVTGPAVDRDQQRAYVEKAFERLARLGVEIVVFGSGGARRVPDDFAHAEAFAQLVDFGRRIAPLARRRGLTVVVEPLRREETNIINSAEEGLTLVDAIGDPNFQLMIDFYHLASEREDPSIVRRAGARLRHLHMANPAGRVYPLEWGEWNYAPFFAALRAAGYGRRMSVEASTKNRSVDAPIAIALLRRAFS